MGVALARRSASASPITCIQAESKPIHDVRTRVGRGYLGAGEGTIEEFCVECGRIGFQAFTTPFLTIERDLRRLLCVPQVWKTLKLMSNHFVRSWKCIGRFDPGTRSRMLVDYHHRVVDAACREIKDWSKYQSIDEGGHWCFTVEGIASTIWHMRRYELIIYGRKGSWKGEWEERNGRVRKGRATRSAQGGC